MPLLFFVFLVSSLIKPSSSVCKSMIYCQGDMLRFIQMSGVFRDSKTFVDMSLKKSTRSTLKHFDTFLARTGGHPNKTDILQFIQFNFKASNMELEHWHPPDFQANPPFLNRINNSEVKELAKKLVDIWPDLGRITKPDVSLHPEKYSLIAVPNGFIVPGGRFREYYYWDSYWIVRGLLICGMHQTARGMIENFFFLVKEYGFIPNGGRIYYLDRSQPPLLTMMANEYVKATKDYRWLLKNIIYLEKELQYWLNNKIIATDFQGKRYYLARYRSMENTPRPESYIEDIHTASRYRSEMEKRDCFQHIRTGAETGWDFSGRWFFDARGGNRGDLSTIDPTRILPVDLNSYLSKSFKIMASFYKSFHLTLHNRERSKFWMQQHLRFNEGIHDLLYNKEDGIWYDYDLELQTPRKYYYPSNFAPLWCKLHNATERKEYGRRANEYLQAQGILKFEGGTPVSLVETGQQWDLPNSWAPTEATIIFGLLKSKHPEALKTAQTLAKRWMDTILIVHENTHEMFEKYNSLNKGLYGGGGEYEVQTGFGWTNGFTLEIIQEFYTATAEEDD